jgi:putative sigma-54 modulation protein
MDIKITAKNIKLTPAIKDFINTRVSKIENFCDHIVSAQVLISVEKKIHQKAEIILHTGAKTTINASAVESNLYKAIDAAAVKAEAQAKKIKTKPKRAKLPKNLSKW